MNIIPPSIPPGSDRDHWEPGFKEAMLIIILLTSYWSGLLAKLWPFWVDNMNDVNAKKIWLSIQNAGDKLVGKLPPSKNHPRGRNPYAHVAICVKNKFSQSYKDIPDENFHAVRDYVDYLVENPSWFSNT